MILIGMVGLAAILAFTDPLEGRLWAAGLLIGFGLLGLGMVIEVIGGGKVWG